MSTGHLQVLVSLYIIGYIDWNDNYYSRSGDCIKKANINFPDNLMKAPILNFWTLFMAVGRVSYIFMNHPILFLKVKECNYLLCKLIFFYNRCFIWAVLPEGVTLHV